jgi:YidC/Oxa1 family membrane protein insertase
MISYLWNLILYKPLLNALAFLVSVIPGADIGLAIVILTILVKIILFPLTQKSLESQAAMTMLTPELDKIKKSGASKEEQARLTFELYKKHKVNPFSGCLVMIPALIIILALYSTFRRGINFDTTLLYSFVHLPAHINMLFLGFVDLTKRSYLLIVLAGLSQYLQAQFMPKPAISKNGDSFQDSFAKSMNLQMKFVFPFLIAFIVYVSSGVVGLYLITSNLFAVGQQIYVKKTEKKRLDNEVKVLIYEK